MSEELLLRELDQRRFTAKDVRRIASLSYRQLNDWDKKGALPSATRNAGEWRRFSAGEAFVVGVLNKLRTDIGVPLDALSRLQDLMYPEAAPFLLKAGEGITKSGPHVFLVTDLHDWVVVEPRDEVAGLISNGTRGFPDSSHFVLSEVGSIAGEVLERLPSHVQIAARGVSTSTGRVIVTTRRPGQKAETGNAE